jgi:hypothetical protein
LCARPAKPRAAHAAADASAVVHRRCAAHMASGPRGWEGWKGRRGRGAPAGGPARERPRQARPSCGAQALGAPTPVIAARRRAELLRALGRSSVALP